MIRDSDDDGESYDDGNDVGGGGCYQKYIDIYFDIDIDIYITFTNWRSVQSLYWTRFFSLKFLKIFVSNFNCNGGFSPVWFEACQWRRGWVAGEARWMGSQVIAL